MNRLFKTILPAVMILAAGFSHAQSSSDKIITLIVPTTPGTGSDIAARLIAPRLSKRLGQQVIVENRTGASGTIGIGAVAKAAPDGNTILFVPNTMAMISSLNKNLPWDPVNDFTPVARIGKMLVSVVVGTSVPVKSLDQLVALAKSKPGQLNYASPGSGTPHHLRSEMFKQITGTDIVHVPYGGNGPAGAATLGGQVHALFGSMPAVLPHAQAGRLRPIAVGTASRSPALPNVPTVAESGYPGFEVSLWLGFFAPKGTPQPILTRLQKELTDIASNAEMKAQFEKNGASAVTNTPAEMNALMKTELEKYGKVVKAAGVSLK